MEVDVEGPAVAVVVESKSSRISVLDYEGFKLESTIQVVQVV